MRRRSLFSTAAAMFAGAGILAGASIGVAQAPGPTSGELLAEGFAGSLGATIGPDGALYVGESGTGSVTRVDVTTGAKTTITDDIPATEEGGGVTDVAFIGANLYVLTTGLGEGSTAPDAITGIYRVNANGTLTEIADIGQFNLDNPVDFEDAGPTGNPFAMHPLDADTFLVTDGNHNRVLAVDLDGDITELAAFDNIVPTGLELDGANALVTFIGPFPHTPENGEVKRVVLATGAATDVATGVAYLIDITRAPDGDLYVLSFGDNPTDPDGPPAVPFTGRLLRLEADGSLSEIVRGLMLPTSLDFIGDTAYIVTLGGEAWKIEDVSELEELPPPPTPTATATATATQTATATATVPAPRPPNTGMGTADSGESTRTLLLIAAGALVLAGSAAGAWGLRRR